MFTRFCGWCCTSSLRGWMELDWNMTPYIYWFQYSATGMFMAKAPPCLRYWLEFSCRCSSRNLVAQSHSMCKMCYCCLCAKQDLKKSNCNIFIYNKYIYTRRPGRSRTLEHTHYADSCFLAGRVLAFGRVFFWLFWTLTASVHTLHMPKPGITFVFKVLRNGLLPYILYTCPNLWKCSCSKCYAMDCFRTYFAHAQTCENVRVQSATQWTASVHTLHMPKPGITFVFKVLRNGLLPYILCTCPNLGLRSCSKCYAMDCFRTFFTHAQTWDYVRVQSATQWTASLHSLHMPKPVKMFVFKVLRNGLLPYILYTCPNLWKCSCSKCYAMDCFRTYFAHAQTWDYVRVQSATQWTASLHSLHMPKPVKMFVFKVLRNGLLPYILCTCPNLGLRSCSKCYAMDCFRTFFTHAQTCENVRVQSATQWTASVHTLHMPKPGITFVCKVLRNGLLPYILYTCPNLWKCSCSKCYAMDCFRTYFAHAQTWDYVRVQSATQWTASLHSLHMPKPVKMFVLKVLRNGLLPYILCTCPNLGLRSCSKCYAMPYILYTCPNLWKCSCSKCYAMDCFRTYFAHAQTWAYVRVQSAIRNRLLPYILYTCPNLRLLSCSKCYAMDCFRTFFVHAQTWRKLLGHSKKSNDASEVKNGLETLHFVVGERPGLRIYLIIFLFLLYIYIYTSCLFTWWQLYCDYLVWYWSTFPRILKWLWNMT